MPRGFRVKRQRVRKVQDARSEQKTSLDVTFLKQDGKGSWHHLLNVIFSILVQSELLPTPEKQLFPQLFSRQMLSELRDKHELGHESLLMQLPSSWIELCDKSSLYQLPMLERLDLKYLRRTAFGKIGKTGAKVIR